MFLENPLLSIQLKAVQFGLLVMDMLLTHFEDFFFKWTFKKSEGHKGVKRMSQFSTVGNE